MESLNIMKSVIENLNQSRQLEILRIIVSNNENYTENMNGTFINLTQIDTKTIMEIEKYLKYITDQDITIDQIEQKKDDFKETFFSNKEVNDSLEIKDIDNDKDNKDNNKVNISQANAY